MFESRSLHSIASRTAFERTDNRSVNSAFKQLKQLGKVEKAIDSLKQTEQNEAANILEDILAKETIPEAIEQMNIWERDHKRRTANFQHLDVVRIKGSEHKGEWGILDVYDEDKFTGVVMTGLGELQEKLVNLEKIELSEEQKKAAYSLMIRLQAISYKLQGKNEPLAVRFIQDILRKNLPELTVLEEVILAAIEVFLRGEIENLQHKMSNFLENYQNRN